MNTENFETKIKDVLSKGAKVSKEAFSKAGNAVQNFSDQSVLKIEKQQLKGKRAKKYEELGENVYALFEMNGSVIENIKNSITADEAFNELMEKICSIQQEITQISSEIDNKDQEIEKNTEKSKKN